MSRALDPETALSLQKEDLQTIYRDVATAICTNTHLEIEFLAKSHPLPPGCNVLVDGSNVAVTKVKLVQAFIVARPIFFKLYRNCPTDREEELRNATAVMLLLDPEHLTAANTRKRLVQQYLEAGDGDVAEVLERELRWVDNYLTARLHRHTKSPTLWGHRRWVLEQWKKAQVEHDLLLDLEKVVLIAAERHPRNYYAWSHMRWLVQSFGDASRFSKSQLGRATTSNSLTVVDVAKAWCLRNPNDTSGFSFLLFSIFTLSHRESKTKTEVCAEIGTDVLRRADSFKWTNESVWVFLRTLAASSLATLALRRDFFRAINTISTSTTENVQVLEKAKEWCVRNQHNFEEEE